MNASTEISVIPPKRRKLLPIGLMLSLPGILALKMGFFFLLIGMAPTLLTIALMRNSNAPYIISTVAAFNFAGVFPDLLSIFLQRGEMRAVLDRLTEPLIWGSMYGAALLGWVIVWLSPTIALMVLEGFYRGRIRSLENTRKKLENEWGPQITGGEQK